MPRDSISVAASPHRVFEVLSDPFAYGEWVVGTQAVLEADGPWPQPGASLRYAVGLGPVRVRDRTFVLAASAPHRLELMAKAGPLPDVAITLEVREAAEGSLVTLDERAAQPLVALAMGPLGHAAVSLRNRRALRRLKRLAEAAA